VSIEPQVLLLLLVVNVLMNGSDEEAKDQMEVLFYGPLRLIQASLPAFRKQKTGSIVNITSIAGLDGIPACGMYAASKFAVEGEILRVNLVRIEAD
jgi:NAD(P)-dependent dehydrogenase (short-subunit alcohol dehydrogenase family)